MTTNNWKNERLANAIEWGDHQTIYTIIETQISLAREEGDNKLIKALELGVEKENKAYKLGYDKGWKECIAHCIANGIPNNF